MEQSDLHRVDPANAEQARAWDGDRGDLWATHADADHFDHGVRSYRRTLMDAAAIGTGDRVLDIGCGTGQATRDAARRATSGSALGVDLSATMLGRGAATPRSRLRASTRLAALSRVGMASYPVDRACCTGVIPANDVLVAAFGGADDPGAVEAVLGVDPGAVSKSELEQLVVALAGRDQVGALLGVVLGVHVRTTSDQASGP